jgi:hypothetical protein
MPHRQALEESLVKERKDRRVCSNAQREGEHGHNSENRAAPQGPKGVPKIASHAFSLDGAELL